MDKLKYYLGTGLKARTQGRVVEVTGIDMELQLCISWKAKNGMVGRADFWNGQAGLRPLMRSRSSLTKPITVEGYNGGEPFVPISHLGIYKDWYGLKTWMENPNGFTFEEVNLLTQWHFWLFDQSEFGKSLIEIKE